MQLDVITQWDTEIISSFQKQDSATCMTYIHGAFGFFPVFFLQCHIW